MISAHRFADVTISVPAPVIKQPTKEVWYFDTGTPFWATKLTTKFGPVFHVSKTKPTKRQLRKWLRIARKHMGLLIVSD